MTDLEEALREAIQEHTGRSADSDLLYQRASGGCIHDSSILTVRGNRFFLKLNTADHADMFSAEADGLLALSQAAAIRVPGFIAQGVASEKAWLLLEYLDLSGRGDGKEMGRQLAQLHRQSAPDHGFGWHRDNYIGATPQPNEKEDSWAVFFREHRLRYQLDLARTRGLHFEAEEELFRAVDQLLGDHGLPPSLLHGDLWGGNAGWTADGHPVIYDPAVYWGDRETDLAFTRMFGGFSEKFYRAYEAAWPLPPGHVARARLYNLYHELNHFNLFGDGYGTQAVSTMRWLIREAGPR